MFDLQILFYLLKGLGCGFAIAAPVGPVGVICVRRTLVNGRRAGLVAGLGAAVADMLYGAIAAFSLTLVSDWLIRHEHPIRLVGGLLLVFFGIRILRRIAAGPSDAALTVYEPFRPGQTFGSTFVLTATNPITIVAFLGIFAAVGIGNIGDSIWYRLGLVAGVFAGSCLWWLAIAIGAGHVRRFLTHGGMGWVNRISGALMVAFGAYALISVVFALRQ
jgi:threonine/homoserine/homoserine lactone efflux protein